MLPRNGYRRTGYYGCPGHLHRGICTNNVYERRDLIEKKLLEGIREKLLQSAALGYATSQLRKGFAAEEQQEQVVFLKKKEAQLRLELTRLAEAIASGSGSKTLMQTLSRKEEELERVTKTTSDLAGLQVPVELRWLRKRVVEEIEALPTLLNTDTERAKSHIIRRTSEIRMHPTEEQGEKFYIAEGEWFIGENEKVTGASHNGDFRSLAGGGFEPPTFGL